MRLRVRTCSAHAASSAASLPAATCGAIGGAGGEYSGGSPTPRDRGWSAMQGSAAALVQYRYVYAILEPAETDSGIRNPKRTPENP